jgi:hypothetical protein
MSAGPARHDAPTDRPRASEPQVAPLATKRAPTTTLSSRTRNRIDSQPSPRMPQEFAFSDRLPPNKYRQHSGFISDHHFQEAVQHAFRICALAQHRGNKPKMQTANAHRIRVSPGGRFTRGHASSPLKCQQPLAQRRQSPRLPDATPAPSNTSAHTPVQVMRVQASPAQPSQHRYHPTPPLTPNP